MNILYFYWGENSCEDLIHTLLKLGHTVHKMSGIVSDYFNEPQIASLIEQQLTTLHFEMVFSFNYLPFLSDIANSNNLLYASWVYDCPHWTLNAKNITNNCNWLFLFDKNMVQETKQAGAEHVFHLPLAVNTERLNSQLAIKEDSRIHYADEISFVGSLYENNHYNRINYLPGYLHGYLDGIIAAQKQLWGYNIIPELLTPEIILEMEKYIKQESSPQCPISPASLFQDIILAKITSDERIDYLNALSLIGNVSLYTDSDSNCCPNVKNKGTVSYITRMPEIFYHSKININITLRSITSGIPLRAIDILGCRGFLLTNYQPELLEWLEPNIDFVYYEDIYDLAAKAEYYLNHEKERETIACNGWRKAQQLFSYDKQVKTLFQLIH